MDKPLWFFFPPVHRVPFLGVGEDTLEKLIHYILGDKIVHKSVKIMLKTDKVGENDTALLLMRVLSRCSNT